MTRRSRATSRISAVARPGRSSERGIRLTPRPARTAAAQRSSSAERSTARGRTPSAAKMRWASSCASQAARRMNGVSARSLTDQRSRVVIRWLAAAASTVGLAPQREGVRRSDRAARGEQRDVAASAAPAFGHGFGRCPPRSRGRRRSGAAPRQATASPRRRAGSRPARRARRRVRRLDRDSARASRQASTMARACGSRRWPAAVRPLRRPRSNRRPPISSSRRATPADSVGWVTWQRSAAAVKLPVSATARK